MHTRSYVGRLILGACVVGLGLVVVQQDVRAQDSLVAGRATADTTGRHVVYETERTTMERVLAFPSNLLHWTTRPIGWGIVWAERNEIPARVENFFWNDARTFGVFPTARLGGPTTSAIGLIVRHERLFGTPREAEASLFYSSLSRGGRTQFRARLATVQ